MKNIDALRLQYVISKAYANLQSYCIDLMEALLGEKMQGVAGPNWTGAMSFLTSQWEFLEALKREADGRWSVRFSAFYQQIGGGQ